MKLAHVLLCLAVLRAPAWAACSTGTIIGQVVDVNGDAAVNRRFTIAIPFEQQIGSCALRIGQTTVQTDSTGQLPTTAVAVQGATVAISLEDDKPTQVVMPTAGSVALSALIGAVANPPNTQAVTSLTVVNGIDYTLSNTTVAHVASLLRSPVMDFHLTSGADAAGHKITGLPNLSPAQLALVPRPLMAWGQTAGGDLTGIWPNPVLSRRRYHSTTAALPPETLSTGTCRNIQAFNPNFTSAMTAAASISAAVPGLLWDISGMASGSALITYCAATSVSVPTGTIFFVDAL